MMFDFQPTLSASALTLRPARAADWDGLFAAGGDPLVWAQHPEPDRGTAEKFRTYFEDGLASGGALVATENTSNTIIGWSRYSPQFAGPGEIEIGWTFLGRPWWGGAYNREMKQLMLAHAFTFVPVVIFRIGVDNLRSRRGVEKLGARLLDKTQPTTSCLLPSHNVYYGIARA